MFNDSAARACQRPGSTLWRTRSLQLQPWCRNEFRHGTHECVRHMPVIDYRQLMKVGLRYGFFALLGALLVALPNRSGAQARYASGQNVVPVFEGWERNADGSFNMVFGYMNRNYEEQVEIPVGPDNKIEPGAPDQGQPTHFYRRRQQFVFKVHVPRDWGQKDLVWTLNFRGKTEKAYGTLLPIWELGNLVYQENRGGPGDMTYPEQPDAPPAIEMVGPAQRTIKAGEPLSLTVQVSDDGLPKPRARRPGAAANVVRDSDGGIISRGGGSAEMPRPENPLTQAVVKLDPGVRLGVTWVLYRGAPGTATIEPMKLPVIKAGPPGSETEPGALSGKATTTVTFSQPGNYRLRAYADDGILITPLDVNVTVQPAQ